jgi:RNA polymerase-binding transcription factor DksA
MIPTRISAVERNNINWPLQRENSDTEIRLCTVSDENESLKSIETTLDGVDRALERLRLGTYRTCDVCGSPIEQSVLEADPVRVTCDDHFGVA